MTNKKGQKALEFLMTYGWAILLVLACIGALAYFGVLSPDRFLPEKCTMPSGIACLDFTAHNDGFQLIMQNAQNFNMENVNIELVENNIKCEKIFLNSTFKDGEILAMNIPCEFNNADYYKYKGEIIITYTNHITKRNHSKIGELFAKI